MTVMLAMSAIATQAQADVSIMNNDMGDVSVYGILDAAVVTQNHSLSISSSLPNQIYPYQPTSATYAGNSVTGLLGGGLSDSRLGIKGGLNVGDGAKAIFNLESGFDLPSGQLNNAAATVAANSGNAAQQHNTVNADSSLNGQLFGRAAWVGINDDDLGRLTMGLQNNPMKDVFASYDPVKSDTFSPFGESGAVGGGGAISEDARMQNSVEYTKNFGSGFTAVAAYQFGNNSSSNGIEGSTGVGNGYALRFGYEQQAFGLQAVYNKFTDAIKVVNSGVVGDIALKAYNTESYLFAGKYKPMVDLTLEAGWENYKLSAPSDATLNAPQSIFGYTVSATTAGLPNGVSQSTNIYFIGGDYNFTPKINVALGYYDTEVDAQTGSTNSGSIKTVSAILTYHVYKSLDGYLVASTNEFSGVNFGFTAAGSTNNSTNTAYGMGGRFKF